MKPYGTKHRAARKNVGNNYCCERCNGPSTEAKKKRRRTERSKARQQGKKEIKDQNG